MALPPYFHRSAVAASQLLGGFDESTIRERLEGQVIGLHLAQSGDTLEARTALDLAVRLVTRLYPSLVLDLPTELQSKYEALALQINPDIAVSKDDPNLAIVFGEGTRETSEYTIFVGSDGWDARIGTTQPQSTGDSSNPYGPGAAACISVANVFRHVFIEHAESDNALTFSTFNMAPEGTDVEFKEADFTLSSDVVLVGVGAIGQSTCWALTRGGGSGIVHLIDHETVELSNLQRYVLTEMSDVGQFKVDVASRYFVKDLTPQSHPVSFASFVADFGYQWDRIAVAVDSAQARREVQASLPQWIANSWTQPGDLGISVHPSFAVGACLACLYLPNESADSEDRLIAKALGLAEEHELQIRQLLHTGEPPPPLFLDQVAERLSVSPDLLEPFRSKPLRQLYVEGICGGMVLPLNRSGAPTQNVHVPVAHQSALAGVLLAARLANRARVGTLVTRFDVTRPVPELPTQTAAKDSSGRCICNDIVYIDRYIEKYGVIAYPR